VACFPQRAWSASGTPATCARASESCICGHVDGRGAASPSGWTAANVGTTSSRVGGDQTGVACVVGGCDGVQFRAMSDATRITHVPLRRARLAGTAPRLAMYALIAVLCVSGLGSIIRGHRTINETFVHQASGFDLAAAAYATEFARAYLTYQSGRPNVRTEALSQFVNATVDSEAGVATEGTQTVSWAEPVQEQTVAGLVKIITVAVQTSSTAAPQYLAVPVDRNGHGALAIADEPSFVGPPTIDNAYSAPNRQPVTNPSLTAMVTRVVTNYLSDDPQDLQADLIAGSQVTLPTVAMAVQHVTNVTWLRSLRVVEVDVTARGHAGATFSLAYFIGVVLRERWYATSISINPAST